MTWAYASTLWGLLLVFVVIVVALSTGRSARRHLRSIGKGGIEWQVRSFLRDLTMAAFLAMIVLAASEPRRGRRPVTGERSGLDVVVAFDVSRSMLAQDVEPSRLSRGISAFRQISGALEARFALVPFKGQSMVLVPMTEDRVVLDMWIGRLGPGLTTVPGTDIEEALRVSMEAFPGGEGRNRSIILISDGEALAGQVETITREFVEIGIPVHVLAAGTPNGGIIPLADGSYVQDSGGHPVVTRTDTETLKRIAEETGGFFNLINEPGAITGLINAIEGDRELSETRGIRFIGVNRYRSFLIPAIVLLLFYLIFRIFPWRRRP